MEKIPLLIEVVGGPSKEIVFLAHRRPQRPRRTASDLRTRPPPRWPRRRPRQRQQRPHRPRPGCRGSRTCASWRGWRPRSGPPLRPTTAASSRSVRPTTPPPPTTTTRSSTRNIRNRRQTCRGRSRPFRSSNRRTTLVRKIRLRYQMKVLTKNLQANKLHWISKTIRCPNPSLPPIRSSVLRTASPSANGGCTVATDSEGRSADKWHGNGVEMKGKGERRGAIEIALLTPSFFLLLLPTRGGVQSHAKTGQ